MNKQKYRFNLTRVRSIRIKYNTGVLASGEYYDTYDYSSTELITYSDVENLYFNLADEFLGHVIQVASFYDGVLQGINNFYIVTEVTRQFQMNSHLSYIIFWANDSLEPSPNAFFQFETKKTHPVFSKLSIDKTRSADSMNYAPVLNTDMYFKAGTFDYIVELGRKDALVFSIERYDYNTSAYSTIYRSLPFTSVDCSLDYDRRQLTVDFQSKNYKAYLDSKLNIAVNIAKHGYMHSSLDFNIPAMMQIYVDGSETITNIVGGSAVDVDISYPETPEDFIPNLIKAHQESMQPDNAIFWALVPTAGAVLAELLLLRFFANIFNLHPYWTNEKWAADYARILYLSKFGFQLIGRICELEITGGNYIEPGSSVIDSPAGFYYATTSDNQITQQYTPTNNITIFNGDSTNWYVSLDTNTRLLSIRKKSDDMVIYIATQPISTSCLLSPDNISGTMFVNVQNSADRCAVASHNVFNVFGRILTTKKVETNINAQDYITGTLSRCSVELTADDFAYTGPAYKYFAYNPNEYQAELYKTIFNGQLVDAHLITPVNYDLFYIKLSCSSTVQGTDTGLGAKDPEAYYTYKDSEGSNISQHFIPIGKYFWSGVSFYATLPYNFLSVLSQWHNNVKQSHFFTVGTAISIILREVAPNVKFVQTAEFSHILYNSDILMPGGHSQVPRPNIYLTHVSNIQVGVVGEEARKVELTLQKIFDMLRDAFQIYYYIDEFGYIHLEHISWFYGLNKINNIQYNTEQVRDAYTKKVIDYGLGRIEANNDYLYSRLQLRSDSDDATELFKTITINCLEAPCLNLDILEKQLGDFKTDIDYLYASAQDRMDGIALLLAEPHQFTRKPCITQTAVNRCDIKGLNAFEYTLWPTNYKASSLELAKYYRWNFASLSVDLCSFAPIDRARYIEQEIQIPIDEDIDMLKLIHTRFGDGFIMSYSIDLDSRYATIRLLHKG